MSIYGKTPITEAEVNIELQKVSAKLLTPAEILTNRNIDNINYTDVFDTKTDMLKGEKVGLKIKGAKDIAKSSFNSSEMKQSFLFGFGKGKYHPDNVFKHTSDGKIIYSQDSSGNRYFETTLKGIKDKVFYLMDRGQKDPYSIFANNTYGNIIRYYEFIAKNNKTLLMSAFNNLFNSYSTEITNLEDISMKDIENSLYDYMFKDYYGCMQYVEGGLNRPLIFYDFCFNGEKIGLACCGAKALYKPYIFISILIDPISNRLYLMSYMVKNK